MISSQVIQNSIDELKAVTKIDIGVYDLDGHPVAITMEKNEIPEERITEFAGSAADSQVIGGEHLLKVHDDGELIYVIVAAGNSEDVYMVGRIAASQIKNLAIAYKDRFDRNNFIQNLLLDNLLLVDIHNRAKKLHIDANCPERFSLWRQILRRIPLPLN